MSLSNTRKRKEHFLKIGKDVNFSEVNSGLFYKTAAERERLLAAERDFITQRVNKILELKKQVCGDNSDKGFVIINQKANLIAEKTE